MFIFRFLSFLSIIRRIIKLKLMISPWYILIGTRYSLQSLVIRLFFKTLLTLWVSFLYLLLILPLTIIAVFVIFPHLRQLVVLYRIRNGHEFSVYFSFPPCYNSKSFCPIPNTPTTTGITDSLKFLSFIFYFCVARSKHFASSFTLLLTGTTKNTR